MKTSDIYLLVLKNKENLWTSFYVYLDEKGKIGEITSKPFPKGGLINVRTLLKENETLSPPTSSLIFSSSIPYSVWNKKGFTIFHDFTFARLSQFNAVITRQNLVDFFKDHGISDITLENYVETTEIPSPIKYKILNVPSSFDNQILFKEAPISIC